MAAEPPHFAAIRQPERVFRPKRSRHFRRLSAFLLMVSQKGRRGPMLSVPGVPSRATHDFPVKTGCYLLLEIDRVLCHLVKGRDHARIRLIAALRDDQVGEFGGDVDVRLLECATR